jgi:hypothetical protein
LNLVHQKAFTSSFTSIHFGLMEPSRLFFIFHYLRSLFNQREPRTCPLNWRSASSDGVQLQLAMFSRCGNDDGRGSWFSP